MIKLKIIDNPIIYELVEKLKKGIDNLNIEKIDTAKNELSKLKYDLELDENELPKEFDEYIVSYKKFKNLQLDNNDLSTFINKAIKNKNDILVFLGEEYE
jgi:thiol-disulfide isomerase/thioredoxin